jgi:hypothetical protein
MTKAAFGKVLSLGRLAAGANVSRRKSAIEGGHLSKAISRGLIHGGRRLLHNSRVVLAAMIVEELIGLVARCGPDRHRMLRLSSLIAESVGNATAAIIQGVLDPPPIADNVVPLRVTFELLHDQSNRY